MRRNPIKSLPIILMVFMIIFSILVIPIPIEATQISDTETTGFYGYGFSTTTTIRCDDTWENENYSHSISITIKANNYETNDQLKINSITLELMIGYSETYREGDGTEFKTYPRKTLTSSGSYSTSMNVNYEGAASEIYFSLTINYNCYVYDDYYGSNWWGPYEKNPVGIEISTNDHPKISSPNDKKLVPDEITSADDIEWVVSDRNDNLGSYTIYRDDKAIKTGSCDDGDTVKASIDQDIEIGVYEYKIIITDDEGAQASDIVLVGVGKDPSGGSSIGMVGAYLEIPGYNGLILILSIIFFTLLFLYKKNSKFRGNSL